MIKLKVSPYVDTDEKTAYNGLLEFKERLFKSMSRLDLISKLPYYEGLDAIFLKNRKNFNKKVADVTANYNISNAWLKCYELLHEFRLIPKKADSFSYFDGASFPGSFICATHHYVSTMSQIKEFTWMASSYIPNFSSGEDSKSEFSDQNSLGDDYGLYKEYRMNWTMSANNNGDVTNPKVLNDLAERIGGRFDLYTSDLGFDPRERFNEREIDSLKHNIGQALLGLLLLKKGGSMLFKHFTFFERETVALFHIISTMFESFWIAKPQASAYFNTEIYVVCVNFSGKKDTIDMLFKGLVELRSLNINVPDGFIGQLRMASERIYMRPIIHLDVKMLIFNEIFPKLDKGEMNLEDAKTFIKTHPYTTQSHQSNWISTNKLLPIQSNKRLKMIDKLGQLLPT